MLSIYTPRKTALIVNSYKPTHDNFQSIKCVQNNYTKSVISIHAYRRKFFHMILTLPIKSVAISLHRVVKYDRNHMFRSNKRNNYAVYQDKN